jgi:hypothetical protein
VSKPKLPPKFLERRKAVTAKRPRTVMGHILQRKLLAAHGERCGIYLEAFPPREHVKEILAAHLNAGTTP